MREFQADFQTGKDEYAGTSSARRPDAISLDYLRSWSIGPVQRSDASQGLQARAWRARADNVAGTVWLRRAEANVTDPQAGWRPESALFTYVGAPLEEIDLAFDQNGNALLVAQRSGGEVWIYWFSPLAGTFVFELLCPGLSPRVLLDDPEDVEDSDILLFYALPDGTAIEMRQQRELYQTVYSVPLAGPGLRVEEVARDTGNRLQMIYSRRDPVTGRYALEALESAPYPLRINDSSTVSSRLDNILQTEVILPFDEVASIRVLPSIEVAILDLLQEVDEEEHLLVVSRIQQFSILDLIINTGVTENLRILSRIQNLGITTTVITTTLSGDENLAVTSRVQSFNFVNV